MRYRNLLKIHLKLKCKIIEKKLLHINKNLKNLSQTLSKNKFINFF